jgi:hypothetical protein
MIIVLFVDRIDRVLKGKKERVQMKKHNII